MTMALLKLVDNVPGVDFYEHRDQYYYNKYEYRARFMLVGVRYTWYLKEDIQELIDRLDAPVTGYNRISYDRDEVRENLTKLEAFLKWRNSIKNKKTSTIRVEHNTVAVFSNDLQELHDIETLIPGVVVDYTQAQTSNYIGIKHFARQPKHNYRVYLKSKRVEGSFALDLHNLFKKSKDIFPCDSLKHWAKGSVTSNIATWRYRFSSATHFIDYDDESVLSYLALMHGDMLGKRYKLEKRPEPI
jgi:hypothetical protein